MNILILQTLQIFSQRNNGPSIVFFFEKGASLFSVLIMVLFLRLTYFLIRSVHAFPCGLYTVILHSSHILSLLYTFHIHFSYGFHIHCFLYKLPSRYFYTHFLVLNSYFGYIFRPSFLLVPISKILLFFLHFLGLVSLYFLSLLSTSTMLLLFRFYFLPTLQRCQQLDSPRLVPAGKLNNCGESN